MYVKKRKPQKTYLKFCGKAKENCRKNLSVKLASFLRRGNLRRHAITHQKSLLNCQNCGKQYSGEDHLKRHQILCNGDSKINQSKNNDVVT